MVTLRYVRYFVPNVLSNYYYIINGYVLLNDLVYVDSFKIRPSVWM